MLKSGRDFPLGDEHRGSQIKSLWGTTLDEIFRDMTQAEPTCTDPGRPGVYPTGGGSFFAIGGQEARLFRTLDAKSAFLRKVLHTSDKLSPTFTEDVF